MEGWVAPCSLLHYKRARDQLPGWEGAEPPDASFVLKRWMRCC